MQNQYAKDLLKEYNLRTKDLFNRYSQLRNQYPLDDLTELALEVNRASALGVLWGSVALANSKRQQYWEEGQ
jgi:hypothetical protein